MPQIKLPQTTLFFSDNGSGLPLVFIHGLGDSHVMFTPQVQAFSPTRRVICPDLRGNGQSGVITGSINRILDRQTDDLAFLFSDLNLDQVVLCGVSYGGVFSLHFALRHPDWLAGLIIADAFSDTKVHRAGDIPQITRQYTALLGMYLPRRWHINRQRARNSAWPAAQEYRIHAAREMRTHEAAIQCLASYRADHHQRLNRITCPTLGIVGDRSNWDVKRMRRTIEAIPGAKFEIVQDALDPTNLCQPDHFNNIVESFLQEIHFS